MKSGHHGMMAKTGPLNLITDVAGLTLGHAHDEKLASGVTVLMTEAGAIAAASVFGGGPGSRELDAVAPENSVGVVDAIVFSGGSAFGLDAATGVQSLLREKGRGFPVGSTRVPIVPQAILFDLLNGADKNWGRHPPYRDLAYDAAGAAGSHFDLGSVGAGFGATVAAGQGKRMRGGVGSASESLKNLASSGPIVVGALAAVNSVGAVTVGDGPHFWAAPFELGGEFGGRGSPTPWPANSSEPMFKMASLQSRSNTTLCAVATDAALTHAQCKRLAIMAAAGMARAVVPVFTPFDGDIVFALSTGKQPLNNPQVALPAIGASAANCLARAIARGVFQAVGRLPDGTPSYGDLFPPASA